MWPKAFAQLVELAPHISRLLPMADRFFQSKTNGDETTRRAMETMASDLRGNLGQVTAAHATLGKQFETLAGKLNQVDTNIGKIAVLGTGIESINTSVTVLSGKVDTVSADARGARLAAESLEARLRVLESRQSRLFVLFAFVFLLLAAVLVLQAILLTRGH